MNFYAILFSGLGVGFVAFCVWLTVRIVNRRERWAKRTAVGLAAVLAGYPLSIGPAGLILNRQSTPVSIQFGALAFYKPLRLVIRDCPLTVRIGADRYCNLWIGEPGWGVTDWDSN
jgi:hypothetical protein